MAHAYEYPRAALTVDCVVFGFDEGDLKLLLIQRNIKPFKDKWALPGGFVRVDESLEEAALRELQEEAGVGRVYLEQLFTFGDLKRDPRERVVTVAYYALVKLGDHRIKGATDARNAAWFSVSDLPRVAFDHERIIEAALERLKGKLRYEPIGFELLPPKFTLTQLQHLYETILETTLDKRNFRKKILGMDLLIETDEIEQDVAHRAARLFRFDEAKYRQLKKKGIQFRVMNALIIVDMQNDFMEGGALAVLGAKKLVPLINRLQTCFQTIVATQDWHPANHASFAANHPGKKEYEIIDLHGLPQTLWPVHCVQDKPGANFVAGLDRARWTAVIQKGINAEIDSYSGFFDNGKRRATGMEVLLRKRNVDHIWLMGVATEYCVKYTALDAVALGFEVTLVDDACRGVELKPGDTQRAIDEMRDAGVQIEHAAEVWN